MHVSYDHNDHKLSSLLVAGKWTTCYLRAADFSNPASGISARHRHSLRVEVTLLLGTNSRQYCDNYLTLPTNSRKPHLLLSRHSSFTPNLHVKHCSSTNPILIHRLLPTSLPVSTPNTIHHSRLTVCLSLSVCLNP